MPKFHPARVAAVLFAAAACRATAQTTAPAISDEVRVRTIQAADRDKVVRQLAASPRLPDAALSDVLRLGVSNGILHVHTRVGPTSAQNRISVTDLPGICTLWSRPARGKKPSGEYAPDYFLFVRYQYDLPGVTERATTVEVLPTNLQITQESETLTDTTQIFLQQQYRHGDQPPRLVLRVKVDPKDDANKPGVSVNNTAVDMVDLRRKDPDAIADFIEPILEQLGAGEALLPVDDIAARQVLGIGSSDAASAIKPLLKSLDDDDPTKRDAAERKIADLGGPGILALLDVDRAKLSPEQLSRVDKLLAAARPLSPDQVRSLSTNVAFVAGFLADDDDAVVTAAVARLSKLVGSDVSFDTKNKGGNRRRAAAELSTRLRPSRR